jgi:hypothetical protein
MRKYQSDGKTLLIIWVLGSSTAHRWRVKLEQIAKAMYTLAQS